MLTKEQTYQDHTIDEDSTLVAWTGKVTSAAFISGQLTAIDGDVTMELQVLRPRSNPTRPENGDIVLTADLDADGDWTTLKTKVVASGDVQPYRYYLPCGEHRLLVHATDAAVIDLEVGSRGY